MALEVRSAGVEVELPATDRHLWNKLGIQVLAGRTENAAFSVLGLLPPGWTVQQNSFPPIPALRDFTILDAANTPRVTVLMQPKSLTDDFEFAVSVELPNGRGARRGDAAMAELSLLPGGI